MHIRGVAKFDSFVPVGSAETKKLDILNLKIPRCSSDTGYILVKIKLKTEWGVFIACRVRNSPTAFFFVNCKKGFRGNWLLSPQPRKYVVKPFNFLTLGC